MTVPSGICAVQFTTNVKNDLGKGLYSKNSNFCYEVIQGHRNKGNTELQRDFMPER